MKRTFWIITCCMIAQLLSAQAPKWAEKARKAVFSIVTYDKDNKIKSTGNGFFVDNNGTALSDYSLFENAERAVIINTDGKQSEVNYILGANSLYDVVKFNTSMPKKQVTLSLASQPAKVGEIVYLLPYSTQKATTVQTGHITHVDSIGNNSFYYTLEMKTGDKLISCPIMNANGEVLGLIQKNADNESTESYAIGATFGTSLSINALSFSDNTLNRIGIKKSLPDTEDQALVYLIMAADKTDKETYLFILNEFIQKYPTNYEGYIRMATLSIYDENPENRSKADEYLEKALNMSSNKEEAGFQVAKTIYSYAIAMNGNNAYPSWTYERALNIIQETIRNNENPLYVQLEGDIHFAQGNYENALVCYNKVNKSSMASPSTFYSAAKTMHLMEGSDINQVISLMDSAIVHLKKPYFSEAAPYFYERAELNVQAGKFREAVKDYNQFYDAVSGKVNAIFYYQREQAEMQCRMYQQGLDDINKAIEMEPENVDFLVEKGAVYLRINQLDNAIDILKQALTMNDKHPVAYRLLGYCQALQNKNKEACFNFAKAKELGDTVVDKLIEKYCK